MLKKSSSMVYVILYHMVMSIYSKVCWKSNELTVSCKTTREEEVCFWIIQQILCLTNPGTSSLWCQNHIKLLYFCWKVCNTAHDNVIQPEILKGTNDSRQIYIISRYISLCLITQPFTWLILKSFIKQKCRTFIGFSLSNVRMFGSRSQIHTVTHTTSDLKTSLWALETCYGYISLYCDIL